MREFTPDGKQPTIYDADRFQTVPATRLAGSLTRHGDVTELLRTEDDRFVIIGPDDVVTVRFDARGLPAISEGCQRSFVLRTWGFGKDAGPFIVGSPNIEPLPFRDMKRYGSPYPDDPLHRDYSRRFNTRKVVPKPLAAKPQPKN